MEAKQQERSGPEALLATWMKSAADFWGSMAALRPKMPPTHGSPDSSAADAKSRAQETWDSSFRMWQVLTSLASSPGAIEGLVKGVNAFPELSMRLIKPAWDGLFQLQKEWMARAGRLGKSSEAFKFDNLDQEVFKAWGEVYEKEFRQFLQIPQLGLTREYQERMNEALDKFNVFQAAMAEFFSMLYLPVEKSVKVMQGKVTALADEGKLPASSNEYYRMWVKILEGHYMTLFKSSEYTHAVARTVGALGDFRTARDRFFQDLLQFLPIPTQKEMDELYKEIYVLKKRIRQLERQCQDNSSPTERQP